MKLRHKYSIAVFFWFILLLNGCSTTYPSKAISELKHGDSTASLKWAKPLKNSKYSANLGLLEIGRVTMLAGDFKTSTENFSEVIETIISDTEEGPVIKVSSMVDGATSTAADDRLRKKVVAPYEFIQALNYQILADIFLGNVEAATVEARRSIYAQEAIKEHYAEEIEKRNQAREKKNETARKYSKAGQENLFQNVSDVLERTTCSYENGLAWYLCGILLEEQNDLSNAVLAYRKASELAPDNDYAQYDFLRLLQSQDPEKYKAVNDLAKINPSPADNKGAEIIIIFEEGLIPKREEQKYSVVISSFDIPIYKIGPYRDHEIEISCDGEKLGVCEKIVDVQALAYHDLKEQMPGVIFRNTVRTLARAGAQTGAAFGGEYATLGVAAFNILWMQLNSADTRSWETLPMTVKIFRGFVAAGKHELIVSAGQNKITIPLDLSLGEKRIIWLADMGIKARLASASINELGAAPQFQIVDSIISK